MERTVPKTASDEVELYLRTIYSLLRSTAGVQIRTIEEVHAGMNSLLHPHARDDFPDTSAFIYSILRLPSVISETNLVVLGQNSDVLIESGYADIENWKKVSAPARRRRCFYDRKGTLACYIASRSDIDDVVPTLTAYQIEWNKLNFLLKRVSPDLIQEAGSGSANATLALSKQLQVPVDDIERLRTIWGTQLTAKLIQIANRQCDLTVRLLGGSHSQYWRATRAWWENIERTVPALLERPLYFISSNTHSVANLLSGFALQREKELVESVIHSDEIDLIDEWTKINAGDVLSSKENFLYYIFRMFQENGFRDAMESHEKTHGITRIRSEHSFNVDAQVIDLAQLDPGGFDPRLKDVDTSFLADSDALILNIDYPLGLAAYNILSKVSEHANPIMGVYIMGKAATLNARVGDVMIPNVVHDEQSQNTYLFQNVFTASDVDPYLMYGSVLDNQKAVSVQGTFLQNAQYMDVFYREGFTDIEMEAGSFLSAVYEMYRPKRHPVNEIINLYQVPFDMGILHYVSDKPLSKGRNLGAGALSYFGIDSTYASTIAILRRILTIEKERIRGRTGR